MYLFLSSGLLDGLKWDRMQRLHLSIAGWGRTPSFSVLIVSIQSSHTSKLHSHLVVVSPTGCSFLVLTLDQETSSSSLQHMNPAASTQPLETQIFTRDKSVHITAMGQIPPIFTHYCDSYFHLWDLKIVQFLAEQHFFQNV